MIEKAKYSSPKTVAKTSVAVIRAERNQRDSFKSSIEEDANFNISPSNSASGRNPQKVGKDGYTAEERAFFENTKKGAMTATGGF